MLPNCVRQQPIKMCRADHQPELKENVKQGNIQQIITNNKMESHTPIKVNTIKDLKLCKPSKREHDKTYIPPKGNTMKLI